MFTVIKPGTKYDFIGKARMFVTISIFAMLTAIGIIMVRGLNPGLDFSGGYQLLVRFDKPIPPEEVRAKLDAVVHNVDTSVQSYDVPSDPGKTYYLTRIQRTTTLSPEQVAALEGLIKKEYGDKVTRFRYSPESGDVVELEFARGATTSVDLSPEKLSGIVATSGHEVGSIRQIGKLDPPVYQLVLRGIEAAVLKGMTELDPAATMPNVEFVGPTVGKQLRDDGILAVVYSLLCMLIYIALRFDFSYAPGAVLTLFHNSVVTIGFLSLIGEEFTLTTIAGLLTLVGYSINDTIVVFDRIRETVGKVKGSSLRDVLNRAINETLSRTVLTATCVLAACICLIVLGRDTVLASYGMIMLSGILIGTYSSIYVATPVFMWFRTRFGKAEHAAEPARRGKTAEAS